MALRLASTLTDAPARDPLRAALATAIAKHADATSALHENEASQKRAEGAHRAAITAVEEATEAVEKARIADAEAVSQGRSGGAVKAARIQLQDSEDALEAARSAKAMLTEQQTELNTSLGILSARLNSAVAAVVRASPETREVIDQFRAAQTRLFELREAVREVWRLHGALPDDAKYWDAINWDQGLPPSETAARLEAWIEQLKVDANAVLASDPDALAV